MDEVELKRIIEAALFVADAPLTIDRLLQMFPEDARPTRQEVRDMLSRLEEDYQGRGVELRRIDAGYRFQSDQKLSDWLGKLWSGRSPRYSRALLETLAIIAYRQPITRGEIEEIRGVSVSSEIVKTLLSREWIRQVGHRDVPGKPALFGTANGFLEHFNLSSLGDLPSLSELRDTDTIARELNLSLDLDLAPEEGEGSEIEEEPEEYENAREAGDGARAPDDADGDDPSGSEVADRAVGD
ncbi:MAG: SMC-Scp complex subunit ScpB [Gammaproteobacteria bacterium]|jgi:segregation and condensation protein B|nr:SMC-Scp complex subunit ScpB [Gammaproteobacteria bacterium]